MTNSRSSYSWAMRSSSARTLRATCTVLAPLSLTTCTITLGCWLSLVIWVTSDSPIETVAMSAEEDGPGGGRHSYTRDVLKRLKFACRTDGHLLPAGIDLAAGEVKVGCLKRLNDIFKRNTVRRASMWGRGGRAPDGLGRRRPSPMRRRRCVRRGFSPRLRRGVSVRTHPVCRPCPVG